MLLLALPVRTRFMVARGRIALCSIRHFRPGLSETLTYKDFVIILTLRLSVSNVTQVQSERVKLIFSYASLFNISRDFGSSNFLIGIYFGLFEYATVAVEFSGSLCRSSLSS